MTPHLIPLIAQPQTLSITMAGTVYELSVSWNRFGSCWVLDIADADGAAMVQGIPLVTGADLLAQYSYLGIDGQLVAQTDGDALLPPSFTNLGSQGNLYFLSS